MNKWVKYIGILLFIVAFFMTVLGGFFNLIILWVGFAIMMIEIIGLFIWQVRNLEWSCDKCKTVFTINWKQSLLGVNGGSVKELYCPHCKKKTWCSPVLKQKK